MTRQKILLIVVAGAIVVVILGMQDYQKQAPVIEQQPITCVVELYNKPREVHEYHGVQK